MSGDNIVAPTPLCQEALWRAVQRIDTAAQYVGNLQFPVALVFVVTENSIVIRDADEGVVELWRGRVNVITRPCIALITKEEVELYQCASGKYGRGKWIYFNKHIVPHAEKEYYEASELYDKLVHIFKKLADHILDVLRS
jgi:hydroxyacyl-ACP dehydratase HTD2-like protein with hotdog domain